MGGGNHAFIDMPSQFLRQSGKVPQMPFRRRDRRYQYRVVAPDRRAGAIFVRQGGDLGDGVFGADGVRIDRPRVAGDGELDDKGQAQRRHIVQRGGKGRGIPRPEDVAVDAVTTQRDTGRFAAIGIGDIDRARRQMAAKPVREKNAG